MPTPFESASEERKDRVRGRLRKHLRGHIDDRRARRQWSHEWHCPCPIHTEDYQAPAPARSAVSEPKAAPRPLLPLALVLSGNAMAH